MGANSDGTAAPMSSVMLSHVTLSQELCSVICTRCVMGLLDIDVRETRNAHNA